MKNDIDLVYANAKLLDAIYCLAIGHGDVRSRLLWAFQQLWPIPRSKLPNDIKTKYDWIIKQLTKYKNPYENMDMSDAEYTLSRIRNRTGAKIAQKIWELKWEIEERL